MLTGTTKCQEQATKPALAGWQLLLVNLDPFCYGLLRAAGMRASVRHVLCLAGHQVTGCVQPGSLQV